MKTRKIHFSLYTLASLIFILAFTTSCSETDLVTPVPETSIEGKLSYEPDRTVMDRLEYPEEVSTISEAKDRYTEPFAIYKLIEFKISTGRTGKVAKKYAEGDKAKVLVHDLYSGMDEVLLKGEGQGWSEKFGRSLITAEFVFRPDEMKLEGEVTCTFSPSGEVVKFMVEGSGPLRIVRDFDGPHEAMILTVTETLGTGIYRQAKFEGTSYFLNASALFNPDVESFSTYLMTTGNYAE